jgi:hypothetical protein
MAEQAPGVDDHQQPRSTCAVIERERRLSGIEKELEDTR